MDSEVLVYFIGMRVCLFCEHNFVYNGLLKHVGKDTVVINDKKKGIMSLKISEIENVESREGKHG